MINLVDTEVLAYLIAGFVLICFFMAFHIVGDGLYALTKRWKEALFITVMALAGLLYAFQKDNIAYGLKNAYATMTAPGETEIISHIDQCKSFVYAQLHDQPFDMPETVTAGFVAVETSAYWEVCAQTFGQNYWKYDITIDGQNGGKALCKATEKVGYESEDVKLWCDTVFKG